jgi:uncharacterized phage protein (TIGR01671 family)
MREIKFRAWDKQGDGMFWNIQNGIDFDDDSHYRFEQFLNPFSDDSHTWFVMQFTGLKDKNGKEIYEGDVVKTGDEQGEVQYDPDQAAYIILLHPHNKNVKSGCYNLASTHPSPIKEIIGNVYENPELNV